HRLTLGQLAALLLGQLLLGQGLLAGLPWHEVHLLTSVTGIKARAVPPRPAGRPQRWASTRPSATSPNPASEPTVTGSASRSAPRAVAVIGLSARKTVTRVGVVCPSAQSHR